MIQLMDEQKKWSISSYDSMHGAILGLKGRWGDISLLTNASVAALCLMEEPQRQQWIALVEQARRMRDDRTMIERIRSLAVSSGLIPPAGDAKALVAAAQNQLAQKDAPATGASKPKRQKEL